MSQVQAMTAILETMQRAVDEHTAYPLEVDSPGLCQVDPALQNDPFVKLKVHFLSADQVELGAPTVKQWGQIWIEAVTKEGTSWNPPLNLIAFLSEYFNCKKLGIVTCLAAGAMPMKTKDGLDHWPLIITFYYHTRG